MKKQRRKANYHAGRYFVPVLYRWNFPNLYLCFWLY